MSLRPKTFAEALERKKKAAQRKRDRAAGGRPVPVIHEMLAQGVVQLADDLVAKPVPAVVRTVGTGPRKVGRPIEKAPRWVSRRWLDGVKRRRCVVLVQVDGANDGVLQPCNRVGVDPHHVVVQGRRGDRFDLLAIPMCRRHHDDAHAGRIDRAELYRLLGAYLCWQIPRVPPSVARVVLQQLLDGLET